MGIQFLSEGNFQDKKVIARFDFNVPLANGEITDTTRIDRSLETIKHLLDSGVKKLVLMSHLGRPKGAYNEKYDLTPVASYLASKLEEEVVLTETCLDRGIKTLLGLSTNKIILLQNLRFHKEEEENDAEFARQLASYGDIYVNDAFGSSHREHASTHGIVKHLGHRNCFAGLLLQKEIAALTNVLETPKKPFIGIIGGAKVSDKIKIIEKLLSSVDQLLIGGAMAYPFLKAKGEEVGNSLCSDEDVILAKKILSLKTKNKLVFPEDHVASESLESSETTICDEIDSEMSGLDIGPKSIAKYKSLIENAHTIIWNGPMGLFENPLYANGTMSLAEAIAENGNAFSLIGGGDSVSAINKSGHAAKVSHISTGGGASLEYIEKGTLPGIQALKHGLS